MFDFHISFLDNPPYQTSWLPWTDDKFVVESTITNLSDTTYWIERAGPCNDCNPELFVKESETGLEPVRTMEMDAFYAVDENSLFRLPPNESYSFTVDWAKYINYDLKRGTKYKVWLEFYAWGIDISLGDSSGIGPIWPETIYSDTLEFTY